MSLLVKNDKYKRAFFIIIIWLIITLLSAVFLYNTPKSFKIGEVSDPSSESGLAQTIMTDNILYGGSRIFILYESENLKTEDPLFINEVNKTLEGLKHVKFPHQVISPYENPKQISPNKHVAYAIVLTKNKAADISNSMPELRQALGLPKHLKMYIGGEPTYVADVIELSRQNIIHGEMLALPICFIVMLFIFGGVIAAILPIISSAMCIIIGTALLFLLARYFDLSVLVLNIATILGLGLGLDYTLLITYRFREELSKGLNNLNALRKTLSTAGKSVFFSGLAILGCTSSLLLFPINVLYSIGVGCMIVILVTVTAALTFFPALLFFMGSKINLLPVRKLRDTFATNNLKNNTLFIIVMQVMKHPFLFFFTCIIFLLFLGYPFLQVKLTRSDVNMLPSWVESRMLVDRFNSNFNANELTPINIVFTAKDQSILPPNHISTLYDYAHQLLKDPAIKSIPSIITEGKYTIMSVLSNFDVNDEHTFALVKRLREHKIDENIIQQVTGTTAIMMDTIKSSYVLFFKIIILISIIVYFVLLVALRSIVLPLKAIIMNFLSLSVCYGMLVYIFQEGHLSWLLNFKPQKFTDLDLPILLFFILFGLSMDYEVFLLTRIKEFYEKTGDNQLSVACGLERSARVITSAAIVVIIVSCSFMSADIVFVKAFGLGTALAIAIDASLIRILLVPATMKLLGKWNWYLPKWLDNILPNIKFNEV